MGGSLKDRIAKLNLQDAPGSTPAAAPSSNQPKSTGAVGKIGDKISSFNNDTAPLVPVGSFGLGGVRREPSSSAGAQGRVASLGGGRAAVPLEAVKQTPRSVSAGAPRIPFRSEGGSSGASSPTTSRASTPAPAAESTDTPTPLSPVMDRSHSQMSSGAMTPGARSVSSMSVEGSWTSEGGPDPKSIKLGEVDIAPSPLSSPVLTALVEPSNVEEADLPSPTSAAPPSGPLKGPLGGLKAPLRSPSSLSVSSMVVEVGDDTTEGSAMDGVETPKTEEAPLPETVGESVEGAGSTGVPMQAEMQQDEEAQAAMEKAREEATRVELDKYEAEATDVTAPPPPVETSPPVSAPESPRAAVAPLTEESTGEKDATMSEPVEQSEGESESGGGYGDILDDFAASEDAALPRPASAADNEGMRVECSDCHEKVDLME